MHGFTLKKGDRRPSITAQILDGAGNPVNLGGGATAKFVMQMRGASQPKVDAAAVVVDPAQGKLQYDWAASDVDTVGVYLAEFEVTLADGKKLTAPQTGYIHVVIMEQARDVV